MIDIKTLREYIDYNPETGELFARKERGNVYKGKKIGGSYSWSGVQYIQLKVFGKKYKGHHIAWAHYYGEWPDKIIDHIDGNGCNNSIKNLRHVTHIENNRNHRVSKVNTSGIPGVTWRKDMCQWLVRIRNGGKEICLGHYDNMLDAASARKSAENRYGYNIRYD